MTERSAERVPRAETVHHVDEVRRHLDHLVGGLGEHTLGALLDDGEAHAPFEEGIRRTERFRLPDGDLALLAIADGDGHVLQRPCDLLSRLGRVRPEHGSIVEVEDGVAGTVSELPRIEVRLTTRLLGESGDRGPQHAGSADRGDIQLVRRDVEVRRLRLAVEVQREVVRREDLAECDGRLEGRIDGDGGVIDAEATELGVQVATERIVTGARDEPYRSTVASGGHGHVRRTAPEELAEGGDLFEPYTALQRVDVDAEAPEGDDVGGVFAGHTPVYNFLLVTDELCPNNNTIALPHKRKTEPRPR